VCFMVSSVFTHAVRMLLSLYFVEAAILLILIGMYKAPSHDLSLATKAGAAMIAGGIGLIGSGGLLIRQIKASGSLGGRTFALSLAANLLTGFITLFLLETTIRILGSRTPSGIVVGSVALQPTWSELTAQSRKVLAGINPWGTWNASYFIYDRELGWTVGSNRRSPDGFYFSSVEGIRSSGPNMRMADQVSRSRIALIGDSQAFSFEVPFEESWGYHLNRLLGEDVQILNFGVDGYGIDQMYLRYQRDVRPWKPQVVVIGFSGHDFWRTMAVYPFVTFGWPGYLVKPRFEIHKDEIKLLNVPLPTPDEILSSDRIDHLPFIEYDLGYRTTDWDWRFEHGPLILRLLTSAFPRWPTEDPRVSEETKYALNIKLLTKMIQSIEEDRGVSLVVPMANQETVLERLSGARVPFLDMTECISEVPADRRTVPSGRHYTGLANLAVARCTAPAVELAIRKANDQDNRSTASARGSGKASARASSWRPPSGSS
jgi:hypothetical protein